MQIITGEGREIDFRIGYREGELEIEGKLI